MARIGTVRNGSFRVAPIGIADVPGGEPVGQLYAQIADIAPRFSLLETGRLLPRNMRSKTIEIEVFRFKAILDTNEAVDWGHGSRTLGYRRGNCAPSWGRKRHHLSLARTEGTARP